MEGQSVSSTVSLETKIGGMLMVGFRGLRVSDEHPIVMDIRERHLGSVLLFDYDVPSKTAMRNVQSPEQVKALVGDLQGASDAPLLVAVDQEGGRVRRLKEEHGFPPTSSAQHLGTADDLDLTREQATVTAQTLAQLGINLNLAPVVDLNINPENPVMGGRERSFSADPGVVTRHAREFVEAHHGQGVLCTLKHFPGHGSSTDDSHLGLVDVTNTWSRVELEPYRNLIEAGVADAIMTAHVFQADLDPEYPATLSRAILTGILREELGYDGVVISDDVQMRAIADHYGFEVAVGVMIEAGVDIISIANNSAYEEDVAARTIALIMRRVEEGKISEARIEASYRRIEALRDRVGLGSV